MTTSVFIHVMGNKAVQVLNSGSETRKLLPGKAPVQLLIHGDQKLTISEVGDFLDSSPQGLAKQAWQAYSVQAGGVTFDGKPLPAWDDLGEDRQKCWVAAVKDL